MVKKILLTGFEPFGNDSVNSSWETVSLVPERVTLSEEGQEETKEIRICKALLPVEYDRMRSALDALLERERPDAVLCVGQAKGRMALTLEYVAINLKDATIPDNAGVLCSGEPIVPDGPAAYFATIPVKRVTEAIRQAGVPAAVSYTAGTYVCNCLMYHLLSLMEEKYPGMAGGFLHLPCSCSQMLECCTLRASFPLDFMEKGLLAAVREIGRWLTDGGGDLNKAAGYTH